MPAAEPDELGSTGATLRGEHEVHFYAGLAPHSKAWFEPHHFEVVGPAPTRVVSVDMVSDGPPEWTATLRLSEPLRGPHFLRAHLPGHLPMTVPIVGSATPIAHEPKSEHPPAEGEGM